MIGNFISLSPDEIEPLHDARSERSLNELVADMRENGWQGRPLLVIERDSEYLAWTGSHRIAAAIEAKLPSIPCYVIPEKVLISRGYDAKSWHVVDSDRMEILKKVGDENALRLMWEEGRSN